MNFMNNYNNTNPIIIGIDHGYGNIKTAHCCFKTGVAAYDKEPTFKVMGYLPELDKSINKFITMSRDEYANFVEDTIQLVIQQFVEKKLM